MPCFMNRLLSLLDIVPETFCCDFSLLLFPLHLTHTRAPSLYAPPPRSTRLQYLDVNLGSQHVPNLLQHRQELRLHMRVARRLHRGNNVAQMRLHDRVKADNVFLDVGVLQSIACFLVSRKDYFKYECGCGHTLGSRRLIVRLIQVTRWGNTGCCAGMSAIAIDV